MRKGSRERERVSERERERETGVRKNACDVEKVEKVNVE